MKIIGTREDIQFVLHNTFDPKLYLPISAYVNWKLENEWDDYNELFHAIKYIQDLRNLEGIWYEIHTLEKDHEVRGVLTMVGGVLEKLGMEQGLDTSTTLLLKYFHLIDKGKGYGSYWLTSVIIPHYTARGFQSILVSSSHPKSFPFYEKLGTETNSFTKTSDNQLYERRCKTFLISLKG
ncbi:MAG: hypothetical protein AAGC85_25485 [Bacteroidota bacterium]